VTSGSRNPGHRAGAGDPSIRRTWWLLALTFLALGIASAVRVVQSGSFGDWLLLVIVVVAAVAAMAHRNAVVRLEARGRGEAEGFARILRGLSRSVSAEAIVTAIMDDLVGATAADHAVLVRRRTDGTALEATLVTRRAGVPPSTTSLPLSDLDAPPDRGLPEAVAVPVGPIVPERSGGADHARPLVRRGPADAAEPGAMPLRGDAAVPATTAMPVAPRPGERTAPAATPTEAGRSVGVRPGFRAGDRPRDRVAALVRRSSAETLALLRDLGLPIPERRRGDRTGPASIVLARGDQALVAARIADRVRLAFGLPNTLTVPLLGEHGMAGVIILSRRSHDPWEDGARRLLRAAAAETAAALARVDTYREAETLAWTDALTGLPNRRYFEESCSLMAQRRRTGDAVAVLMVDIDKFKLLNDRHGHPVGDEVLKAVAAAIGRTVREQDVPARVGGEEFAVLLRNPGPRVAVEVGERLREEVGRLDLRPLGVSGVTVSVGVAQTDDPDEPITAVVERADRALLKAKRSGRNQVVAAGSAVRA
jgi:diguanylate cyclase (GGDEF)-like protein